LGVEIWSFDRTGGRFQFGIGIAHAPAYVRMEVKPGKPLGDIRAFVEKFKSHTEYGPLPPVILATLRKRMIALSAEIAEGLVFANGSRAHMSDSLGVLPAAKRSDPDFFIRHHHPCAGAALARRQSDERAQGGLRRLRAVAPAGLSVAVASGSSGSKSASACLSSCLHQGGQG
jgi:alkanesulfonate monooxygenase SsuD/methylene tetrahydromethanopterin reductase-like flavin-dependent oxidoreductase (luciferase family)